SRGRFTATSTPLPKTSSWTSWRRAAGCGQQRKRRGGCCRSQSHSISASGSTNTCEKGGVCGPGGRDSPILHQYGPSGVHTQSGDTLAGSHRGWERRLSMQPVIEHRPVSTPALRVRQVDPTTDPRWAAFVASHPNGLAFHHPAWLATLADTFNFAPVHLACEDEHGALHGVLPLFYRRGLLRGRQLWSLPYTPIAGP